MDLTVLFSVIMTLCLVIPFNIVSASDRNRKSGCVIDFDAPGNSDGNRQDGDNRCGQNRNSNANKNGEPTESSETTTNSNSAVVEDPSKSTITSPHEVFTSSSAGSFSDTASKKSSAKLPDTTRTTTSFSTGSTSATTPSTIAPSTTIMTMTTTAAKSTTVKTHRPTAITSTTLMFSSTTTLGTKTRTASGNKATSTVRDHDQEETTNINLTSDSDKSTIVKTELHTTYSTKERQVDSANSETTVPNSQAIQETAATYDDTYEETTSDDNSSQEGISNENSHEIQLQESRPDGGNSASNQASGPIIAVAVVAACFLLIILLGENIIDIMRSIFLIINCFVR